MRSVLEPGKGNVVRRMFSDIDADCYILVDGDGSNPALVASTSSISSPTGTTL